MEEKTHEDHSWLPPTGPLNGVVVVDLSRVLTGPFAAMLLGDLGARVIKVERPGTGDDTRHWGPPFVGPEGARESAYFLSANRNKQSIVLDLRSEEGHERLLRLVERADVAIENFRPGVMERLGLGFDVLHRHNPRLVVLSITGFGHDGPEADRTGYDQIVQGEAGLMSLTGPGPDSPTKVGVPIADLLAGIFGAYGVVAALHERNSTGSGRVVRASLLSAVVATHAFQGTRWLLGGQLPTACGNMHPTVAPYGAYSCQDGLIQIAVGNDSLWQTFSPLVGIDADDARFRTNALRVAHRDELEAALRQAFGTKPVEEWLSCLDECGIPAGIVKTLDQVYESPQVIAQCLIAEVEHATLGNIRLPGPPLRFDGLNDVRHQPPPTLGQHTDDVLRWLDDEAGGA